MIKKLAWIGILFLWFSSIEAQEKFRRLPPYPEPIKEWRLPRLETVTLTNGLKIAVISRRNSPFISLQLILMIGESFSPESLPGLATVTARLMSRGTTLLSASTIEEKIESIGGQLEILVSCDRTLFSFIFLKEYLNEALSLLSQIILQPAFASNELEAVRRTLFYDLAEKRGQSEVLAERQLLRWLLKGHPYEKSLFNEESIRLISRRDIQDFYNRHYRPENALLVVGGNITLSEASKLISHYFNIWKGEEPRRPAWPTLMPLSERILGFIDLPRSKEVTITMGNVVASRSFNDIFPLLVLNQVFGGSPHSRLFMNLRETRQLAYIAFSKIELLQLGWLFLIQIKSPPESLLAVLKEIDQELNRLIKEKLPAAEIEQAKSFLLESFPLGLEPIEVMTRRAAEILALKMEEEYWNSWPENILTLEAARITEVSQRLLMVPFSIVIVGDSRRLTNFFEEYEQLFNQIKIYDYKGQLLYTLSKGDEK
ncbi:MAG: insulinase family protein [Candidatus Aminicenantes bacterium]|nr:insulinase family protein [Candidatus Aminicenantes bacterium]